MRICDLRQKEVINSCNCRRLGFVCDIEFDIGTGKIIAIIVPGCGKICGLFGRDSEYDSVPLYQTDWSRDHFGGDCGRGCTCKM